MSIRLVRYGLEDEARRLRLAAVRARTLGDFLDERAETIEEAARQLKQEER